METPAGIASHPLHRAFLTGSHPVIHQQTNRHDAISGSDAKDDRHPEARSDRRGIALCVALAASVFIADLVSPPGMLEGTLYSVAVLAAVLAARHRAVFVVASVCTGLSLLGYLVGHPTALADSAGMINRGASFVLIWLTAILGGRLKRDHDGAVKARSRLELANRELAQQARLDHLTGVANRRHFDERLAAECRLAQRARAPLSLVLIDIDHFKSLNDSAGHQWGDTCLADIARTIAAHARRPSDFLARYGGEEFALLLPGISAEDASARAETVRAAVECLEWSRGDAGPLRMTISAGVATVLPKGSANTASVLIEAADRALYEAKHRGRNRVCSGIRPVARFLRAV